MSAGDIVLEPDKLWFQLPLSKGMITLKWRDLVAIIHVPKTAMYKVDVRFVQGKFRLELKT